MKGPIVAVVLLLIAVAWICFRRREEEPLRPCRLGIRLMPGRQSSNPLMLKKI
jgi:hypothetical protein